MNSGIYHIRHISSEKRYIGSAVNLNQRWRQHKHELFKNKHSNPKLQNAWNKYGSAEFEFSILSRVPPEELITQEQIAIDLFQPEYNICKTAGSTLGRTMSAEARHKMSVAKLGRPCSPQDRENLAKGRRPGGWNKGISPSPATRLKMSIAQKGKQYTLGHTLTPEHRHKLSLALLGNTNGVGKNLGNTYGTANKGQTFSKESCAKGWATRRANKIAKSTVIQ